MFNVGFLVNNWYNILGMCCWWCGYSQSDEAKGGYDDLHDWFVGWWWFVVNRVKNTRRTVPLAWTSGIFILCQKSTIHPELLADNGLDKYHVTLACITKKIRRFICVRKFMVLLPDHVFEHRHQIFDCNTNETCYDNFII